MSEIDKLRARVSDLEGILGLDEKIPLRHLLPRGLWLNECEPLCGLLLAREFVSRTSAYIALYGARPECDQPEMKIVDVVLVRLRQALGPQGIEIRNSHGTGWFMTGHHKERLRRLIERRRAELIQIPTSNGGEHADRGE